MVKHNGNIEALLDRLDNAQTDEEIYAIGKRLLELDPANPHGKLAVWEAMGFEDSMANLSMLREALMAIRTIVLNSDEPAFIENDRDSQVYGSIMMNLGYALLAEGEMEEALNVAKELANFDDEGYYPSRTLLYRCMLGLDMYAEILATLESDPLESVVGEHARAIAMIELGEDPQEIREAVAYAISLAPNVPFFVLGIWDFPDDGDDLDDDVEEVVQYAAYLSEPWTSSDARLVELSTPTFMFGYLTERLEDKEEIALLVEGYETAGLKEKVETARAKVKKMIAANEDIDEVDAVALGETEAIIEELMS